MMDNSFENNSIPVEQLPKAEEVVIIKPKDNYLYVSLLSSSIFLLVIFIFFMIGYFALAQEKIEIISLKTLRILLLSLFLLFVIYSLLMSYYNYKLRGYALRENDIIYKKGVFVQSLTTIPFNRVQHCEISQGPIDRLFDLNSLLIYTAGGQGSDMKIVGLEAKEASQLKAYIVSSTLLSSEADGEEE